MAMIAVDVKKGITYTAAGYFREKHADTIKEHCDMTNCHEKHADTIKEHCHMTNCRERSDRSQRAPNV